MLRRFKRSLQSIFRELLLYHNSSLEFRAKVFAVVIAANSVHGACEQEVLKTLAHDIYNEDNTRAEILIDTVNEYLLSIDENTSESFHAFIHKIEHEAKTTQRFKKKIDMAMLHKFRSCSKDFEDRIYQQRVFEFLKGVKK